MGLEIDRAEFDEEEYPRFAARLEQNLAALREVLARPGFGEGPASIGAELELSLVDGRGRPLPLNRAVLASTVDPRVTLELDRFNLEINTRPSPLAGRPFKALAAELTSALAEVRRAATLHGGRVATVGILPTLTGKDLDASALTDFHRYRALSTGLRRLRRERFAVRIDGDDPLAMEAEDVTLEGANTSFQVHLRVSPQDFAAMYNAAQIAAAPALAVAGNSPLFLGHRLWEETRIALFRQAVDDRFEAADDDWRPARVSFGHGWAREGAFELFAESVALHAPLLPVLGSEDALSQVRQGGVPALEELKLHHGTVWRWNRAVYDAAGGGHLRIELRTLPAGPTVGDMVANAAFMVGLTLGLWSEAKTLCHGMTFGHARRNFYEAARKGLEAKLLWPRAAPPSPEAVGARALVERLLPVARRGLVAAGVEAGEAEELLGVIEARVRRGRTGARWQREVLAGLESGGMAREAALAGMLERYLAASEAGAPVHGWEVG
jgi:gamma-glutamyl:cysteine ligase YbdK (ATP-grasp superfamily)